MTRKRPTTPARAQDRRGALPLDEALDLEPSGVAAPRASDPALGGPVTSVPVDDEVVGVDRTGAHPPLSDALVGGAVVIEGFDLESDRSDELPAILSSVAGEIAFDDEPFHSTASGFDDRPALDAAPGLGDGPDRTAAYDPPPELFADIPDPEAAPLAAPAVNRPTGPFVASTAPWPTGSEKIPFHDKATDFVPLAKLEEGLAHRRSLSDARNAALEAAGVREAAVIIDEPEFVAPVFVAPVVVDEPVLSLFDPEPDPDAAVETRARASEPVPTPAAVPAAKASRPGKAGSSGRQAAGGSSGPRDKKPEEKPHRPPGPMHRPIVREPTPPPRAAADPAENELTGVYEPPEAVPELPRGKLTILEGENQGKSYFLNRNRSMLGRGIDNDIVLMDIAVSRKHFRVDRHGEGFKLVDLGSGNGTALNGRRVGESELYDGDRIDLGNTTLEFVSVGRTRIRAAAGTDEAPITDHGRSQTPISPVRPAGARIPWTWVGLWAAATFLAMLVGLILVRRHQAEPPENASGAAARAHVELAQAAMRARDWKRAEEELAVARQLGPELAGSTGFDDTNGRIGRERDAQRRLDEARRKVGIEPPAAVQALLLGIGRDSAYYTEARSLIAELDTLAEANRNGGVMPSTPPGLAGAAVPLPGAAAPPTSVAAPAAVQVDAAVVLATRPPRAPAVGANATGDAEKRARADVTDALRLYRDEKFPAAASALEKAAQRAPGTKTAKDAQAKARLVREYAEQSSAAEKALRSRRAREASEALSRALATDRRLGGHHREKLQSQLGEQLYMVAIQAYNRQAYDEAVQANSRVLELSSGHALATRLQDKMRRSAMAIAKQAQQALDSGDRDTAKRMAQAALKLVSESDSAGKAARKVLDKL